MENKLAFTYVKKKIWSLIRRLFIRPLNQLHRYDFPESCNGWFKQTSKPVWGNRDIGTMFDPYVFLDGNDFKMLVSDRRNKCLVLLDSEDGKNWKNKRVVLEPKTGTWESEVNRGCLIKKRNRWFLWYTGQYNGKSCIGLAKSDDGVHFCRVQSSPVLHANLLQEGVSVMNPCVLWDESVGLFKMWYSAGENYEPDVIFFAESRDGIKWVKRNQPVLSKESSHKWECYKVGGCQVVKENDLSYRMYYIGYQNIDVARICNAFSTDGINWSRENNNLILSPSKKSWDSDAVYKPTIVRRNGKTYLWYNGRRKREEYIGFAIKDE